MQARFPFARGGHPLFEMTFAPGGVRTEAHASQVVTACFSIRVDPKTNPVNPVDLYLGPLSCGNVHRVWAGFRSSTGFVNPVESRFPGFRVCSGFDPGLLDTHTRGVFVQVKAAFCKIHRVTGSVWHSYTYARANSDLQFVPNPGEGHLSSCPCRQPGGTPKSGLDQRATALSVLTPASRS
jgi:hypothetical protein